jgi:LacI family transcriptional regulator
VNEDSTSSRMKAASPAESSNAVPCGGPGQTRKRRSTQEALPNPPTLADVARAAGVGKATASRALNGRKLVSPESMEKVLAAARELNFSPNHAARVLKGEPTKTIGLVVPDIGDPFFAACAGAVHKIARGHQTAVMLMATENDPAVELECIRLISHRVDGLILVPGNLDAKERAHSLDQLRIPVVALDRPLPGSKAPAILLRNCKGAQMAMRHLVEHGRRRILCLGEDSHLYTVQERLRGYRQVAVEAGLSPLIHVTTLPMDYDSVELAIRKFLADPSAIDAIFTLKNLLTIHVLEALRRLHIDVPGRIALLGFDDFELARALQPAITVIEQPAREMGSIAAEQLFNCLKDPQTLRRRNGESSSHIHRLEPRLVLGSSCGCSL